MGEAKYRAGMNFLTTIAQQVLAGETESIRLSHLHIKGSETRPLPFPDCFVNLSLRRPRVIIFCTRKAQQLQALCNARAKSDTRTREEQAIAPFLPTPPFFPPSFSSQEAVESFFACKTLATLRRRQHGRPRCATKGIKPSPLPPSLARPAPPHLRRVPYLQSCQAELFSPLAGRARACACAYLCISFSELPAALPRGFLSRASAWVGRDPQGGSAGGAGFGPRRLPDGARRICRPGRAGAGAAAENFAPEKPS